MNAIRLPYRWKYIQEHQSGVFADWFIFGEYGDGSVDIAHVGGDIIERIPRDKAKRIIAARDQFLAECERVNIELLQEERNHE